MRNNNRIFSLKESLYKWSYSNFKLWESRWYTKYLLEQRHRKGTKGVYAKTLFCSSILSYMIVVYGRYWQYLIVFPITYIKRIRMMYSVFLKRLMGKACPPPLL